jgi:hypothetical protein
LNQVHRINAGGNAYGEKISVGNSKQKQKGGFTVID